MQQKPYYTFPLTLVLESDGQKKYNTLSVTADHPTPFEVDNETPLQKPLLRNMPPQIVIDNLSFVLNDRVYNQASDVFFGVFRHPFENNRVAALFWPLSSDCAESVARKITHYGKYSYLAFQNGKNKDKGIWQINDSPLVYPWSHGHH